MGGCLSFLQLVVVLIGLVATESTFSNPDERLRYAHGGCMSVWTILTLGGMFASRMMKHKGRLWIKIHAIAMVTASVAGIGGILLGIMNGANERSKPFKKTHFLIEYVTRHKVHSHHFLHNDIRPNNNKNINGLLSITVRPKSDAISCMRVRISN